MKNRFLDSLQNSIRPLFQHASKLKFSQEAILYFTEHEVRLVVMALKVSRIKEIIHLANFPLPENPGAGDGTVKI